MIIELSLSPDQRRIKSAGRGFGEGQGRTTVSVHPSRQPPARAPGVVNVTGEGENGRTLWPWGNYDLLPP